jgi:3-dehydroquinate dehydratase-2
MTATNKNILVINGPNLNLLGDREPDQYGRDTLKAIESRLSAAAEKAGARLAAYQSNAEAELVDRIQQAGREKVDFIIINPAAYTHTSVAILDALKNVKAPIIELHISNTHQREKFRHRSFVSAVATATMMGLGVDGYPIAVEAMSRLIARQKA